MTMIALGNFTATLNDRKWSSPHWFMRVLLESASSHLFLHGGLPDVEEAIVAGLKETLPIEVIYASPRSDYGDVPDDVIF